RAPVAGGEVGEVEEGVPRELPPAELRQEAVGGCRVRPHPGGFEGVVPYRMGAQLAPAKPRREEGRGPGGGLVTRAVIVLEVVFEEAAQTPPRGELTRHP